ncbi:MAG: transcription termination/antitermination protein NusA [Caldilineaceae bacterium]|nr:transcription termination/antitermination protein NusA [Caldilineaceae bacterium]
MSKALIAGINQVATDKGLDREVIFTAIEAALVSAYKRNYGSVANVSSEVDRVTGDMRIFAEREVVEELFNVRTEILEAEARKIQPTAKLGDVIRVETHPDDFGRIAAQTAKQVILQRIREAERDNVYENFAHQVGEIVRAQVRSIDAQSGAVTILLDEKHEVLMMRDEQITTEKLRRGDYIRVYVVDVHKSTRGPVIKLSRTHRNLLRRLMEQEIPEVRDGIVEIKSIAREPGARSKASVVATVPGVDPVGSCVGMRGLRIQNIVNELANEKIDVVEWSADPATYISNALSPAKVSNVILDEKSSLKTAIVVVPDRQLSLAIGKEGQNARLAAKLTGWRIDIKSESEAKAEGLDQLVFERAKAEVIRKSDDLLSVAERILLSEQQSTSNDRLWEVAQSLNDGIADDDEVKDAFGVPGLDNVFPPLDEVREGNILPNLPNIDELAERPASRSTEDAWSAALEAAKGEIALTPEVAAFSEVDELDSFTPIDEERDEEPAPVEAIPPAVIEADDEPISDEMTLPDELPQVITADMLRARMAQRRREVNFEEADFVIPEELLAGIDEDEDEDIWTEGADQKGKGKAKKVKKSTPEKADKAPKAKKKKRRSGFDEEDEFGSYFKK